MLSQSGLRNTSRPSGYAAKLNMLVYLTTKRIKMFLYISIYILFVCFVKHKCMQFIFQCVFTAVPTLSAVRNLEQFNLFFSLVC